MLAPASERPWGLLASGRPGSGFSGDIRTLSSVSFSAVLLCLVFFHVGSFRAVSRWLTEPSGSVSVF